MMCARHEGDKVSGRFAVLTITAFAVVLSAAVAAGTVWAAEGREAVEAGIDDKCRSKPADFQVPEGKTATDFKREVLEAGKSCHEGGEPENVGFSIKGRRGKDVYYWSRYKNNKPYEKGGPLKNLELEYGEYTLTAAGGAGAKVRISYKLK